MKKFYALLIAGLLIAATPVLAQTDTIILTTPDQVSAGTGSYVLTDIEIGFATDYVSFTLTGENGEKLRFNFTGPEGAALLNSIMSSNAPIKNLQRLGLLYLINNGHLDGVIAELE